jgi:ATP-dependent helicase/DNAse subunit B
MLDRFPMPLQLVTGPPNSGRAGHVRRGLLEDLDRDPVLVLPNVDDVYAFERELCEGGAVLGATVTTLGGLFRMVAAATGAPPGPELTPAQRLGAVSRAIGELRGRLGPLGRSARRPGFAPALERLLDELQAAGLEPAEVEAAAATLEGSAYLADVAALFSGYAAVRDGLGMADVHGVAREAIDSLRASPDSWRARPLFLYGFDDLTPMQLELIEVLAAATEVTVALPFEPGNRPLESRVGPLLTSLREIGVGSTLETPADPANTDSPLLFHLERGFGSAEPGRRAPEGSLRILRSAGERGEAESIGLEVARLLAAGCRPEEVAIVLRDPGRRGPLIARVLESYGVPVALEAELPAGTTAVGGALIALLDAELGEGTAADLLRYMRGPSGVSARRVDWFERELRRRRVEDAAAALRAWKQRHGELPGDVASVREAAGEPRRLAGLVAGLAVEMASRQPDALESSAAAAISSALSDRAELEGLEPEPAHLSRAVAEVSVRVWSGPVEGRVRIADPYRLRAGRFDHVFVASLQDGEFPRRDRGADPFLSERQRQSLGLPPRRDTEAEERYLFHAALALPRKSLFLSYRDSDENGGAEPRSPFLDDVRRLIEPGPVAGEPDPTEGGLTISRDLAQVVHRVGEAPSEDELARAVAAHGRAAEPASLLAVAAPPPEAAERAEARLVSARAVEAASRAPGPITNPAVLESLAAVPAYGGTTLEGFETCSYLWFVSHELSPQPLDPVPDPLLQGGLMHEALERLYRERPGGDALPRPASLAAWTARAAEIVEEVAQERRIGGQPGEIAMRRRVEGLVRRFLAEEAGRDPAGFEPWLLEAKFGDSEESEKPDLELDGWRLHGAIDRVDRAADGRALVLDYKLSSSVTSLAKLEERGKLQLQLYVSALERLWGVEAVGGLYHPMRGGSDRHPRGLYLEEAREDLASYAPVGTDAVDRDRFSSELAYARRRGGEIVSRMRAGDIRRDPGPREGLRGHDVCPAYCRFAPICRRDRAPVEPLEEEDER